MTGDTASVEDLRRELQVQLALIEHRALIVLVEASGTLDDALDDMLGELSAELGLPADAITRVEAEPSVLKALNHDRDALMRERRLIWLRARHPADVRTIRDHTPDLTAVVDLYMRAVPPPGTDAEWARCRDGIKALMVRQHGHLDVGVPIRGEWPTAPIGESYCPLVNWPGGASHILLAGSPGSGKSTALRHLAWTYSTGTGDPLGVGERVPILVSLHHFARDRVLQRMRPFLDFLVDWLERQGIPDAHSLLPRRDRLLLLLDNLDELRSAEMASGLLVELAEEIEASSVVVAARPWGTFLHQVGQPWRVCFPRVPSAAERQRLVAIHTGDKALYATDVDRVGLISPGALSILARTRSRLDRPARSMLDMYHAYAGQLMAASHPSGLDGRADVVMLAAWAEVNLAVSMTTTVLTALLNLQASNSQWMPAAPVRALSTWFIEHSAFVVLEGDGYRFVGRDVADFLAARRAAREPGRLLHMSRSPRASGAVLSFTLRLLGERYGARLVEVAREVLDRASSVGDDHLLGPLLVLADLPMIDGDWDSQKLHEILAGALITGSTVGAADPFLQREWVRVVRSCLSDERAPYARSGLRSSLVEARGAASWFQTPTGRWSVAEIDDVLPVDERAMRRWFGEAPPHFGRLLALADLPVEPLVTHLRARPEWWLRLLADWTEATYAAPEDEIVLPVPQWLKDEAAARSD